MCASVSHPITARSAHMHQAALPGRYVTFVVTTWWQCGQRTTPGLSLRYVRETGTGCGWVTITGWVCLLLTDGVTPTEIQRVQEGQRRISRTTWEESTMLLSPAHLVCMHAIQSNSENIALIPCVSGWIVIPVFCEGDVTAVGTLGGVRTGKGSGWIVTTKKTKKKYLRVCPHTAGYIY